MEFLIGFQTLKLVQFLAFIQMIGMGRLLTTGNSSSPLNLNQTDKNVETLEEAEVEHLMSLDLGIGTEDSNSPFGNNTSLLAIIESLENLDPQHSEHRSESQSPEIIFDGQQRNKSVQPDKQKLHESDSESSIVIVENDNPRYPSPLVQGYVLDRVPSDIYENRIYQLFRPRGYLIKPKLNLTRPRGNQLPPFQTLIPGSRDSFFSFTNPYLQGDEIVHLKTYGILKAVKSSTSYSNNQRNRDLLSHQQVATQQHMRSRRFVPNSPVLDNQRLELQPNYGNIRKTANPVQVQQHIVHNGYNPQLYHQNFQQGQNRIYPHFQPQLTQTPSAGVHHQYINQPTGYRHPPLGFSGGSLNTYVHNQYVQPTLPSYAHYNSNTPYVRSTTPAYSPFTQQQLTTFHPNLQGGAGPGPVTYCRQSYSHNRQTMPPFQGNFPSQARHFGTTRTRPSPYESHREIFRSTPPQGHTTYQPYRVSPTSYYRNYSGAGWSNPWEGSNTKEWSTLPQQHPIHNRNVTTFGRQPTYDTAARSQSQRLYGEGGEFLIHPSGQHQQVERTEGNGSDGRRRVNPYIYFGQHIPNISTIELVTPAANDNPIPQSSTIGNPPISLSGSQQQASRIPSPSSQEPEISLLSQNRGPVPFYSQATVDGHYRRVSGHNETAKDKEFEDDSELLQWYIQQAKQVLRERHEKDAAVAKESPQQE